MKPFKPLLLGIALISVMLITTGKTFGSPGVHKDSVKVEAFTTSTMTTVVADHVLLQAGEINFCLEVSNLDLPAITQPKEGFFPALDTYRSDHYQVRNLPPVNDELKCPALRLNPDNPVQRI